MPRSYTEQFVPLLEAALEEEIGLFVETDNRHLLTNVLYDAMKLGEFGALAILQPAIEGKDGVLFIAKKTTELVE